MIMTFVIRNMFMKLNKKGSVNPCPCLTARVNYLWRGGALRVRPLDLPSPVRRFFKPPRSVFHRPVHRADVAPLRSAL